MKLSVIHNTYKNNPYIRESVILNLKALKEAGVDYQYIVFNDNGDTEIENQVKDLDVEYFYSDFNFGMKMCSGGWIGAIPLLKGELVHNTGQDDIFTPVFYRSVVDHFQSTDCDLVYCNGFKSREDLTITGETMGPIVSIDYSNPKQTVLNQWFGLQNGKITRTNNFIPAPGTVYKTKLHDEIGKPDLINFKGAADFEYWARVLFFNKKVHYIPTPNWLYRISNFSHSQDTNQETHYENTIQFYLDNIKNKYQKLLDNE